MPEKLHLRHQCYSWAWWTVAHVFGIWRHFDACPKHTVSFSNGKRNSADHAIDALIDIHARIRLAFDMKHIAGPKSVETSVYWGNYQVEPLCYYYGRQWGSGKDQWLLLACNMGPWCLKPKRASSTSPNACANPYGLSQLQVGTESVDL